MVFRVWRGGGAEGLDDIRYEMDDVRYEMEVASLVRESRV